MYRVREEIDEVVGDKTSVEADDLDKLTYMNQVFISCKCKFYTAKKVLQQFGNRGRSPRFPNSVLPPRRYKTVLNHVSLVYLEFFVPSSFLDGRKNR